MFLKSTGKLSAKKPKPHPTFIGNKPKALNIVIGKKREPERLDYDEVPVFYVEDFETYKETSNTQQNDSSSNDECDIEGTEEGLRAMNIRSSVKHQRGSPEIALKVELKEFTKKANQSGFVKKAKKAEKSPYYYKSKEFEAKYQSP